MYPWDTLWKFSVFVERFHFRLLSFDIGGHVGPTSIPIPIPAIYILVEYIYLFFTQRFVFCFPLRRR